MAEQQPETFDDWLENIKQGTEEIGKGFKEADDDWHQVLLTDNTVVSIADLFVGPEEAMEGRKDLVADFVIPYLVVKLRPKWAALTLTSWVSRYEKVLPPADQRPAPSKDPNRREALVVTAYNGEAKQHTTWVADIKRLPDHHAELENWTKLGGGEATGRMAEALPRAFSLVGKVEIEKMDTLARAVGIEIKTLEEMKAKYGNT